MRVECLKHGDVEGVRNEKGRLACSICEKEKKDQPRVVELKNVVVEDAGQQRQRYSDPKKARARAFVDEMFERSQRDQARRQNEFMDMVADAVVAQQEHRKKNGK